ncbi:MAG: glycosyltransferase family 39 protein [Alphaproteobacteria bacterium]
MSRRATLALFAAALALRLVYLALVYDGPDSLKAPDSRAYEEAVEHLVEGSSAGGPWSWAVVSTLKPERVPGYILFLALLREAFGGDPLLAVLAQLVIDSASVVVIARLAAALDPRLALASGLLAAANLNMIAHAATILSETLFLLPFVLSLHATVLYMRRPGPGAAAAAGAALGVAMLVRSAVLFFPAVLAAGLLWGALSRRIGVRRGLLHLGGTVLALVLLVGPVVARNQIVFGHLALVSQTGNHMAYWAYPAARDLVTGVPFAQSQREVRERYEARLHERGLGEAALNPFGVSGELAAVARDALAEMGPGAVLGAWAAGIAINLAVPAILAVPPVQALERPRFYATPGRSAADKVRNYISTAGGGLFFWIVVPAAVLAAVVRLIQLAGLARIGRELPVGPTLWLLLGVAYVLVVTGPVTGVKYRLPIEPVLVILLAAALRSIACAILRRRRKTAQAAASTE